MVQWFFLRFREGIVKSFGSIFSKGDKGTSYSSTAQFNSRWGWYNSIYAIARGDLGRFDEATKTKLIKALTWLSYEKEKSDIENAITRKQIANR